MLFTIEDSYEKMTFEEMPDGSYFECDGSVCQKVRWKGENAYVLNCKKGEIATFSSLVKSEFYLLVMDPSSVIKFRRVVK